MREVCLDSLDEACPAREVDEVGVEWRKEGEGKEERVCEVWRELGQTAKLTELLGE